MSSSSQVVFGYSKMNNHQASVKDVKALLKAELKRVGQMLLAQLSRQLLDAKVSVADMHKVFDDVSFVGPMITRPP